MRSAPSWRRAAGWPWWAGGYIGLEVASTAKGLGLEVCVIEAENRLLGRVTAPEMSGYYARAHRARGVEVRLSATVGAFEGNGKVEGVRCGAEVIPADLVVVGIGVVPDTELAEAAGIACDDGIVVDERCATSAAPRPCGRGLHPPPEPHPRPHAAARIGAERDRAGEDRGGERRRHPGALRARPPGSGATSSTSSSRWSGSPTGTTPSCNAARWTRTTSRCST